MIRCEICSAQTSSKSIIYDKRYSARRTNNEVHVCPSCCEDWQCGREEKLMEKIKNKLTTNIPDILKDIKSASNELNELKDNNEI